MKIKLKNFSILEPKIKIKAGFRTIFNSDIFVKCTKPEYDAMETHNAKTIYYVYDYRGDITLYLGSTKMISESTIIGNLLATINPAGTTIVGNFEVTEE